MLLCMALPPTRVPGAAGEVRIGETAAPGTLPLAAEASFLPSGEHTWLVFGRISGPVFSISDPAQLRLVNGVGDTLPLTVEMDSVFREFGDIVALVAAFEFDPQMLSAGPLRLEWGPAVKSVFTSVPVLTFPPASAARIRPFSLFPPGADQVAPSQFATLEIIADSHADHYYLWYLLPMAVIFILLAVRKKWNS